MSGPASSSGAGGSELLRRLSKINEVDKRIDELVSLAQTCITELSKEKQISKSKMEEASSAFKRTLNAVESELNEQMQYLSHVCVGTPHQGSTFASQQNVSLAEDTLAALHQRLANIHSQHMEPQHPPDIELS